MERYGQRKTGLLEVICGPMFSGKTEELIRRVRRAQIARQKVVVFKPAIDCRYDPNQVVSHSAQRVPSLAVDSVAAMAKELQEVLPDSDVVGIDEAQFFDMELIQFVDQLADRGVRVIVAGLDQDYLAKPFGPIPNLLAIADLMTKQYAVCVVCGAPASKTQRTRAQGEDGNDISEQVIVGAIDRYEARCRRCHIKGIDFPFVPN